MGFEADLEAGKPLRRSFEVKVIHEDEPCVVVAVADGDIGTARDAIAYPAAR